MKNLLILMTCVCVTLFTLSASAQTDHAPLNEPNEKKPLLFAGLPERIPVSVEYINSLFGSEAGRSVSLGNQNEPISKFEGKVMSSGTDASNRIQSVVIRSTNFQGARFTVSKVISEQGVVSYTGRILSFQHGDAYELKNESGNLVLVKSKFNNLVME